MRKIIVYVTEELSDLSDKDHKQFWWNQESPHNIVQKHILKRINIQHVHNVENQLVILLFIQMEPLKFGDQKK